MSMLFLNKNERFPVDGTVNVRELQNQPGLWEGEVQEDGSSQIYLRPVDINADKLKYLQISFNAAHIERIRVCFSKGIHLPAPEVEDMFDLKTSFSTEVENSKGDLNLIFDLSRALAWEGSVASLRIHFIGVKASDRVKIFGIGFSESVIENPQAASCTIKKIVQQADVWATRKDRMAAFQETIVAVDFERPNAEIRTWALPSENKIHMLMKVCPFIIIGDEVKGPANTVGLKVWDFPGGVHAEYRVGNVEVNIKLMPLLFRNEIGKRGGFALYHIKTDQRASVLVEVGGGKEYNFFVGESPLKDEDFSTGSTTIEIIDDRAVLQHDSRSILTAVRSAGRLEVREDGDRGTRLGITFAEGEGYLVIGFGEDKEELCRKIQAIDPVIEEAKVVKYYEELLCSSISTPEPDLDVTFRSAVYNLEYSWLKPYGWIETIREFNMMFHQQHTASADWLGQYDRSKECLEGSIGIATEEKPLEPLQPDGGICGSFGGENQYFTWEARHYFRHTHDLEFAQKAAGAMDKIIAQTFGQHDGDNDLLLGWSAQIANQEDYSMHPNNSTSPSIEGINMLRFRIVLAEALNDLETAGKYRVLLNAAKSNLQSMLWKKDLGRFIFYADFLGKKHLEGQYHSFAFPLIWEIIDPLDAYTSIRHLCDRLTGSNGEVYTNNNFPCHGWGAMALAAVQPWAALALACAGKNNDTYKTLLNVAHWTIEKGGSFTEGAGGDSPNYFSPCAAVYVMGIIEAVFGLDKNIPRDCLEVRPSFPDDWPAATLVLPDLQASYMRAGNHFSYQINTAKPLTKNVRWIVPPARIFNMKIDGESFAGFTIEPLVSKIAIVFSTPIAKATLIEFDLEPLEYSIRHTTSIAEGSKLTVTANGCTITRMEDRCSVVRNFAINNGNELEAVLSGGLLDEYKGFGRLGRINFAKRTFFLECRVAAVQFWHPVDLTILPAYEACQMSELEIAEHNVVLSLLIRNNTEESSNGKAALLFNHNSLGFDVDLKPRSESIFRIRIENEFALDFNAGDNVGKLVLENGCCLRVVIDAASIYGKIQSSSLPSELELSDKFTMIPLAESDTIDHTEWKKTRNNYIFGHTPYSGVINPLAAIYGENLSVAGLPVPFLNPHGRFISVSFQAGRPFYKMDLRGAKIRKLYFLMLSFVDNHDVFSVVGKVAAMRKDGACISKPLYFPGDIDGFYPEETVGIRATAHGKERHRHGLLDIVKAGDADYMECSPVGDAGFPRPEHWCDSRTHKTPASVMNVIELELGGAFEMDSVMLFAEGTEPAFGLVAVTGEL